MNHSKTVLEGVTIHHVDNDINGNSRVVVHFLALAPTYEEARRVSRSMGGSVYRAKWYGGGFVFGCSPENLVRELSVQPTSVFNRK